MHARAKCAQEEWPALVIVPASLRLVWAEELARWLPALRPAHIHVIEGRLDRLQGAHPYKAGGLSRPWHWVSLPAWSLDFWACILQSWGK